ncbi:hypothetical protein QFC19_001507 [Naganishia cerealis]|uniref:Uncharacterized protein n=1 Tax=Naganishia cerealis TaxID=610337 RepID=A0ACC2WG11_9TREE|nr:hypothetical protein QFC19_001507 [Naganishia cerealis]
MKQRGTSLAYSAALRRPSYAPLAHRRFSVSSRLSSESPSAGASSTTERPNLPRLNLDASTSSLLHDLHLGTGSTAANDVTQTREIAIKRKYRRPTILDEKDLEALNDARRIDGTEEWVLTEAHDMEPTSLENRNEGRTAGEDSHGASSRSTTGEVLGNENDPEHQGREERRSPAALFGTKRIGSVMLPEELSEAIQRQIDGTSVYRSSRFVD